MHEICSDIVDLKDFVFIYAYLEAKLRVGRAEFVFRVGDHEIIS